MKKIILSIALIIAMNLNVYSQETISDGGFENCWVSKTAGRGAYLDFADDYFFKTLNLLYSMTPSFGEGPLTSFKETSIVYDGNTALKIVSGELSTPVSPVNLFIPGAMGNIDVDIIGINFSLGRPFTSRPQSIKGWYQYAPVNGDSAAIEILLEKNGTVLGRGKEIIRNAVSDWSQFNVSINYTSDETPDTIVTIFAASAKYDFTDITTLFECKGQIGSALYLDDISFEYEAGIKEMLDPEIAMSVYPNPSEEEVTVQVAKETKGTIIVYDYLSRKVGEYPINGTQIKMDVRHYAQGSYLLNVVENNKVITTHRFVKH
jgi:hypothetical protein